MKKRQLMELAIINGTYRDSSSKNSSREYLLCHEFMTRVTTATQMSHSPVTGPVSARNKSAQMTDSLILQ